MADSVTSFGSTITNRSYSNVDTRLRVWYTATRKADPNYVTLQVDVEVDYNVGSWSMNGASCTVNGSTRRANPNNYGSIRTYYASTGSSSRTNGSSYGWTFDVSVSPTSTSTSINVGFANTLNAAQSPLTTQSFSLSVPIGWTGVGAPGAISYGSYWNESSVTFSWGGASGGTSNPVTGYHVWIDRSSDGGSSWPNIVSVDVGASTRSYTYTFGGADGRGYRYRANIYTLGTYNNSGQTSGPTAQRNYQPTTPSISTINGTSPSANMLIAPNAYVYSTECTDGGGFSGSYTSVNYRAIYNGVATAFGTSRYVYPTFSTYCCQTISVYLQSYDGFVLSGNSTAYNVKIGTTMSVAAPTFTTTSLTGATGLSIPRAYINSSYASTVNESITVQYSFNNSTWYTFGSYTRPVSTITSSYPITNILYTIYSKDASQFLNSSSKTIYIRTVHTAGHLSVTSASASISYIQPVLTASITYADSSSIFKYPMNNTIPVTEASAQINWNTTSWTSGNSGTFYIQARKLGASTWTTIYSYTVSANTTNSFVYPLTGGSLPLSFGDTVELKGSLILTTTSGNITLWDNNINWNIASGQADADKNRIERRIAPIVTLTQNTNQLSFLRNGITDNTISIPFTISWDINKAFVITYSSMYIGGTTVTDTSVPKLLFSTTTPNISYATSNIKLAAAINTDRSWNIASTIITDTNIIVPSGFLLSNSLPSVYRSFTVKEAFRSTPTGTTPSTSLLSVTSSPLTMYYYPNTYCDPIFNSGSITYTRILS